MYVYISQHDHDKNHNIKRNEIYKQITLITKYNPKPS